MLVPFASSSPSQGCQSDTCWWRAEGQGSLPLRESASGASEPPAQLHVCDSTWSRDASVSKPRECQQATTRTRARLRAADCEHPLALPLDARAPRTPRDRSGTLSVHPQPAAIGCLSLWPARALSPPRRQSRSRGATIDGRGWTGRAHAEATEEPQPLQRTVCRYGGHAAQWVLRPEAHATQVQRVAAAAAGPGCTFARPRVRTPQAGRAAPRAARLAHTTPVPGPAGAVRAAAEAIRAAAVNLPPPKGPPASVSAPSWGQGGERTRGCAGPWRGIRARAVTTDRCRGR